MKKPNLHVDKYKQAMIDHKKQMLYGSIVLYLGCIMLYFMEKYDPIIFMLTCAIVLTILYFDMRIKIKKYETYRNSGRH